MAISVILHKSTSERTKCFVFLRSFTSLHVLWTAYAIKSYCFFSEQDSKVDRIHTKLGHLHLGHFMQLPVIRSRRWIKCTVLWIQSQLKIYLNTKIYELKLNERSHMPYLFIIVYNEIQNTSTIWEIFSMKIPNWGRHFCVVTYTYKT